MIMDRPIAFACDHWETHGCYRTIETAEVTMRAARKYAKRVGWKSSASLDLCPDCAAEPPA